MRPPAGLLRVGTALVGIPLVVGAVVAGGWPFLVLVVGVAAIAQYELYSILTRLGLRPWVEAGLLIGLALGLRSAIPAAVPVSIALALVVFVYAHVSNRFEAPFQSVAATLTGAFYPTLLITYLIDLRGAAETGLGEGAASWLTMTVIGLVWVSDTAAYYVGRSIGKRPLAPEISPKKTWEGSIGGAVATVLAALSIWWLDLVPAAWYHLAVLGLICGTVGQLGDLAESRLKRMAQVKDSGTILPGHGGILDRIDAMIVAVPLCYLYLAAVARIL